MSSTITETELRTISKTAVDAPDSHPPRDLTRSISIEKLKKFNNYICSQHYYILPSLLLWLKASQTRLASNMEKCIMYMKLSFPLLLQKYEKQKLFIRKVPAVAHDLLLVVYEDLKQLLTNLVVYLSVFLILFQLAALFYLMLGELPPLGFLFLVVCIGIISRIAIVVFLKDSFIDDTETGNEKQRKSRKPFKLIRKRISNIKLF